MKTRQCVKVDSNGNQTMSSNYQQREVVFFGSYGRNADGTSKKAQTFVENQEAVANSLIQRLNVLRGELWYNVTYGMPLVLKSNKSAIDAFVCSTILSHPDVIRIQMFTSKVENHAYICKTVILLVYGNLDLEI